VGGTGTVSIFPPVRPSLDCPGFLRYGLFSNGLLLRFYSAIFKRMYFALFFFFFFPVCLAVLTLWRNPSSSFLAIIWRIFSGYDGSILAFCFFSSNYPHLRRFSPPAVLKTQLVRRGTAVMIRQLPPSEFKFVFQITLLLPPHLCSGR